MCFIVMPISFVEDNVFYSTFNRLGWWVCGVGVVIVYL